MDNSIEAVLLEDRVGFEDGGVAWDDIWVFGADVAADGAVVEEDEAVIALSVGWFTL